MFPDEYDTAVVARVRKIRPRRIARYFPSALPGPVLLRADQLCVSQLHSNTVGS
jgi:hypothetical protein